MSLKDWAANGWLKAHTTSKQEIIDLFAAVDRDRADATKGLSDDWKFNIAYNAARGLCTALLYAAGYRADRDGNHFYTIGALKHILGTDAGDLPRLLEVCRKKRNTATYESIGLVSAREAEDLLNAVDELRAKVVAWFKSNHPKLLP
jgi:hypothetical protein